jgi:hypothetical protein
MWNLVERARKGDESTLPGLRKMLVNPVAINMLGGNLSEQAQRALVKAAAGENVAFREGLLCKLKALQAELAGTAPTPLERLLVERVVTCWLFLYYAEAMMAQTLKESMERCEFHQRRVDRAHKRYLSAMRTLAQVRKLAVPMLQVNVARKQVNIAAPAAVEAPTVGHDR